jgi:acyl-CoA reductase-like NAD-dependent aldehyde dehydrogenase
MGILLMQLPLKMKIGYNSIRPLCKRTRLAFFNLNRSITIPSVVPSIIHNVEITQGPTFTVMQKETDKAYAVHSVTKGDINGILESVKSGQAAWDSTPLVDRRDIFFTAASLLKQRKDILIESMHDEVGIPTDLGVYFAEDSVSYMLELGSIMASPTGKVVNQVRDKTALVVKQPVGPVLSIVPWNASSILATRAAACPIAAGCAVTLKTSPYAPYTQYLTLKALLDAGLPPGVLNIVHCNHTDDESVVNTLIASPVIRKINFTGSTVVGRKIAVEAAKHLKPVVLELGGKGAVIVTKSADLSSAATFSILGSWVGSGQVCMSTERIYVVKEVAVPFMEILKQKASELQQLPIVNGKQITDLRAYEINDMVEDAVSKGATIIYQDIELTGEPSADRVKKTILGGIDKTMKIHDHETFGPLSYINVVQSVDEAIAEVNSSKAGLNSSIWTSDIAEGIDIANRVESGAVHINGSTTFDYGTIPHGGVKGSGYGRFGGQWGIDEFSVVKCITWPV